MSRHITAAVVSATLLGLVGCAGSLPVDPATAGNDPANPDAPTAPFPPASQTLAILDNPAATTLPADRHQHAGPGGDMGGMKMGDDQ